MKSNWKNYTLEQVCKRIYSGGTPSTAHPEYWGGDINWLSSGETGQKYIKETIKKITALGVEKSSTKLAQRGCTVVASAGQGFTRGQASFLLIDTYVNQSVIVFDADDKYILPRYLYYNLDNRYEEFRLLSDGTSTRGGLSGWIVKRMGIELPPIEEQAKIVSLLQSIDEKIELNTAINNNLQQQARALFKAWFVDFEPFGGEMPTEWHIGKLKDILRLKRDGIKVGDEPNLPYLPIDVIPMKTFAVSEFKPNEDAQSSLITFDKDDIVIGAMRVYFHRVIFAPCRGITRTTCFTLKPYDADYLSFGLLCCDQDSSIDYAQTTSKGSTMPYAVWDGGLGDMEIAIPPKDIAKKFNDTVLPMLRHIQESYFENRNLVEIRDSLLPRLMSGEIDVSGVEI